MHLISIQPKDPVRDGKQFKYSLRLRIVLVRPSGFLGIIRKKYCH